MPIKPEHVGVHNAHCYQGEYFTSCKYGDDDDCPRRWAKQTVPDRQTRHPLYQLYRSLRDQPWIRHESKQHATQKCCYHLHGLADKLAVHIAEESEQTTIGLFPTDIPMLLEIVRANKEYHNSRRHSQRRIHKTTDTGETYGKRADTLRAIEHRLIAAQRRVS